MNVTEQYFKENVEIRRKHKNKESAYYEFEFENLNFYFCISTHHGEYRGKTPTFISNNQDRKTAIVFAWELYLLNKKKDVRLSTKIKNDDLRHVKRNRDRVKKRLNNKKQ